MRVPTETLVLFLTVLESNLVAVPNIQAKAFRVFTMILDSKDKADGVTAKYNRAITNADGTVTPYNGTRYLLELLGVSEADYNSSADVLLYN